MIKVRFAPSPTGALHIGGARTALFNWLYARNQGGKFFLRIEDTDRVRSRPDILDDIFSSLKWLGLDWDEELYFQSEHFSGYREFAERLIKEGKAYYDGDETQAVRFRMPKELVKISDLVHGEIEFDNSLLDDLVIIKSDGSPTYNFACVIDDYLMEMTHIIRGDDHISNTPKQAALYKALDFKIPKFAHIPLITDNDKARLSKRTGATALSEYKEAGYLPEALFNFLALLGWSPGGNQEIFSKEEAIKKFSIKKINKTSSIFDRDKLDWINGQYMKKKSAEEFLEIVMPFLKRKNYLGEEFNKEWLLKLVELYKGRCRTLVEFIEQIGFFFVDEPEYDAEAVEQYLKKEGVCDILRKLKERVQGLEVFEHSGIEKEVRALAEELKIKAGEIIHPARVAISGKSVSAGFFEIMALLGKEKSVKRLERCVA